MMVLAVLLVLLGACSSDAGSDSAVEPASGRAGAQEQVSDEASRGGAGEDASADDVGGDVADLVGEAGAAPAGTGPMMVRRVTLEVLVEDVSAAVARARATATSTGGWVSSEEVSPGDAQRAGWATVVLRVPSEDLDGVVTSLSELGEVTGSRSSADDVKSEYRDLEARVATLEAGADRLRELVAEATSVESVATLERELADREVELDALKARMQVLAEDVSRSTVTLHLAEDRETLDQTAPDTGFLAGLAAGWDAFVRSVTLVVTALGALLPFLALALLVAVPLLLRRRRRVPRPQGVDSIEG